MKNPCERLCPDRSVMCHAECLKYLRYAEELQKRREATRIAQEPAIFFRATQDRVIHRLQRKTKPSGGGHKD